MQIADLNSAHFFLYSRIDYERVDSIPYRSRVFKLDRMRDLLARLGHPHHRVQIVHIAGTKGKGSTAAMIASVMDAAGYRTGLFTSPHLERIEERFVVAGRACSENEFVDLVAQVERVVSEMDSEAAASSAAETGPTYFEITTAIALLYFCQSEVDLAVMEVGLGGRLDSTNVCLPLVTAITSISLDHTAQLGNTVGEIATEKSGIIKPNVPVVSGVREKEAGDVIEKTARHWGAPLFMLGHDFDFEYALDWTSGEMRRPLSRITYREPDAQFGMEDIQVGLPGKHQASNASVAIAVLGQLRKIGWEINEGAIRDGLANVSWPARVEVFDNQPMIVVDGAHNVASIEALIDVLRDLAPHQPRRLIFATSSDKDADGMLQRLLPEFTSIVFTRFLNNPRSISPDRLAQQARNHLESGAYKSLNVEIATRPDPRSTWQLTTDKSAANDLICITGSFFIAAELRQLAREFVTQCQGAV
jgi:dihydrofolate synthase/folylpolyglutamate synthase